MRPLRADWRIVRLLLASARLMRVVNIATLMSVKHNEILPSAKRRRAHLHVLSYFARCVDNTARLN